MHGEAKGERKDKVMPENRLKKEKNERPIQQSYINTFSGYLSIKLDLSSNLPLAENNAYCKIPFQFSSSS